MPNYGLNPLSGNKLAKFYKPLNYYSFKIKKIIFFILSYEIPENEIMMKKRKALRRKKSMERIILKLLETHY